MDISGRLLSTHNLNEFERCLNDFQKEVLKLRLVYEHIGSKGFTNEADSLMGECVAFIAQYMTGLSLLFDCVSRGVDMNPESD